MLKSLRPEHVACVHASPAGSSDWIACDAANVCITGGHVPLNPGPAAAEAPLPSHLPFAPLLPQPLGLGLRDALVVLIGVVCSGLRVFCRATWSHIRRCHLTHRLGQRCSALPAREGIHQHRSTACACPNLINGGLPITVSDYPMS